MRNCIWSMALLLAAGASGCGDDDATPDDGGRDDATGADADADAEADAEADADADADADAADEGGGTGTLTVRVTIADPSSEEGVPAAGVVVAADLPGGGRVEQATGADGRTTFGGIDWAAGTAAATAWRDGYGLVSRVGITEADGEIELALGLPLDDAPARVEVSGTALHMADPVHHSLLVSATTDGESFWSDRPGPHWSIQVAPDDPFTIIAAEFAQEPPPCVGCLSMPISGWVVQEHAAVTAPTTVELDFATPAAATRVTGSFQTVTRGDSPLRTPDYAFITVFDLDSMAVLGMSDSTTLGAGGTIEFDLQYVTVAAATHPLTGFRVVADDWVSGVVLEGFPASGAQDLRFVDAPRLIAPARPTAHHPFHEPLRWELFDSALTPVLRIFDDEQTVWWVRGPEDATTVTVPEAPSGCDLAALIGTGIVEAQLYFYHRHESGDYSDHYVQSPSLILEP